MNVDDRFISPRKAAMLRDYAATYSAPYTPQLRRYEDVELVPLGVVADADPRIQGVPALDGDDRCADIRPLPALAPPPTKRALYLGYMRPEWGHFLIDALNRMWAVEELDLQQFDEIVMSAMSPDEQLGPNHRLVLRALLPGTKIVYLTAPAAYRSLTVPDLNYSRLEYLGDKAVPLLRRLTSALLAEATMMPENCPRSIFLTRSGLPAARTKDLNIALIDSLMRQAGYTVVHPERHSIADLAMMMHRADRIASVSGSAAHNLLFAPEGANVTILERFGFCNFDQVAVALTRRHRVTYVDASLSPYPVDVGGGPFLWWPTRRLTDCLGLPPRDVPPAERRRLVSRYLRTFRHTYGAFLPVPHWIEHEGALLAEAVACANEELGPWLKRGPLWRRVAKKLARTLLQRRN